MSSTVGAGGIFTNNNFDGAFYESIKLALNSLPAINSTNTLTNAPSPYLVSGQDLPMDVYATFGAGIVDIYSLHFTGSFAGANTIMGPDPIGNGNSIWVAQANTSIASGARVQVDANTVLKFKSGNTLTVKGGGTLDVYGTVGQPVIFTEVNDDAYGAIVNGSTGTPTTTGWSGIEYWSGSSGSMNYADIYYATVGVELTNVSLVLSNLNIREFASSGVMLKAGSGQTTSPTITNLNLSTTSTFNYPLYFVDSGGGIIAPTITGGTITTASTSTSYGVIQLSGAGTTPTISGFTVSGGVYSIQSSNGAGGSFTNNIFDGASAYAIRLKTESSPTIDASNTISNTPVPYYLDSQLFPATVSASFGAGAVDTYSVYLNGSSFAAGDHIMSPDPMGTGTSIWHIPSAISLASTRLQIDPYTIVKFGAGAYIQVYPTAVLDVYGTAQGKVIFTSIKDDSVGGDTNGDGAVTTPAPGNWEGIKFATASGTAPSESHVMFADINYAGNGVYVRDRSPILSDVTINEFAWVGLYLYAGSFASPTITNLVLKTTDTVNTSILMWDQYNNGVITPTITGGSITTASTNAEVIKLNGAGVNPTISSMTVDGGLYGMTVLGGAGVTFTDSIFRDAIRSGIYLNTTGLVTLSGNKIVNNNALNSDTGTGYTTLYAGISVIDVYAGSIIENNLIRGNGGDIGAGMYISSTNAAEIRNNLILDNNAATGGGIGLTGSAVLKSNTVANNRSRNIGGGGGLYASFTASFTATDNIFALNVEGGATARGDMLVDVYAAVTESYNLVSDGPSVGTGDIYADPQFVDYGWYVLNSSPVINADGLNAIPVWLTDTYTEIANVDSGNLDFGYHHDSDFAGVDPSFSTITIAANNIAALATTVVTITPRDANNNMLGAGLNVSAVFQNAQVGSEYLSLVRDQGDGTYEVIFTAGPTSGSNIIQGWIGTTQITVTVSITWP